MTCACSLYFVLHYSYLHSGVFFCYLGLQEGVAGGGEGLQAAASVGDFAGGGLFEKVHVDVEPIPTHVLWRYAH